MNAVTQPVQKALSQANRSPSWTLYLDKFSFQRNAGQAGKNTSLSDTLTVFRQAMASMKDVLARQDLFRIKLRQQYGDRNVRVVYLKNTSRLLLHLARVNPLENVGLYAERISGVPIIPGTAVKGVLSTWACWCQNISADGEFPPELEKERRSFAMEEAKLAEAILGNNDKSGSTQGGGITFIAAWPMTVPALDPDITTPHGRGNPIPNPFLAVAPGTTWAFTFVANPLGETRAEELLNQTETWLKEALDQMGIGAKTAAGYGRFSSLTPAEAEDIRKRETDLKAKTDEAEKQRQKAIAQKREADEQAKVDAARRDTLSPEDRSYEDFLKSKPDWKAKANTIDKSTAEEKAMILRFFRTPLGQAELETWTNEKGIKRLNKLKEAGL